MATKEDETECPVCTLEKRAGASTRSSVVIPDTTLPLSTPRIVAVSSEFPQHRKSFQVLIILYFITEVNFYTTVAFTISL